VSDVCSVAVGAPWVGSGGFNINIIIAMDEEDISLEEKRPELMEEEDADLKNDIFEQFLVEANGSHFMEIEKI
jgi:hypothetical protein